VFQTLTESLYFEMSAENILFCEISMSFYVFDTLEIFLSM